MKRRNFMGYGLTASLLTGCHMERSFKIGWREEIQVSEGVIVLASVEYTYERLGSLLRFDKYSPSILRVTEFSFSSNDPFINFSKVFPKHRVNTLRLIDKKWYLVLEKCGADVILQTSNGPVELFGDSADETGHKFFSLDSSDLIPASIDSFSDNLIAPNLLMGTAGAGVLSAFNGQTVTLTQKAQYLSKYPLDSTELRIKSRHDSIRKKN